MSTFAFPQGTGKPVCVFCASSPGNTQVFTTAAISLGASLANANMPVVYGGGRRGLMGVVSQAALQSDGVVHGVLPRALAGRASEATPAPGAAAGATKVATSAEGQGADLLADDFGGRLTMSVVGSMHERKALMAKLSTGGFVVLPGGFGTFEELFEMVTWNQIGMHQLPVLLLNIDNFYEPIKQLVANGVKAGFIGEKNAELIKIIDLGDAAANADPSRATEWGPVAVQALQSWKWPAGAGYGFTWTEGDKTQPPTGAATPVTGAAAAPAAHGFTNTAKSHYGTGAGAAVGAGAGVAAGTAATGAAAHHPHLQQAVDGLFDKIFNIADTINPKAQTTHHAGAPAASHAAVPPTAPAPAAAAPAAAPAAAAPVPAAAAPAAAAPAVAAPAAAASTTEWVDPKKAAAADAASAAPDPVTLVRGPDTSFPPSRDMYQKEHDQKEMREDTTQDIAAEKAEKAEGSWPPSLFTTTRFTSPAATPTVPITQSMVFLWPRHVARLRSAHAHFLQRDGAVWGTYPGDDVVWAAVKAAIEAKEAQTTGDWRVRIVLRPNTPTPTIDVQLPDANAPPYGFAPAPTRPPAQRKLYLDATPSPAAAGADASYRLYKTERRGLYAAAAARVRARGARLSAGDLYPEVVLHTGAGVLLEGTTSNIALLDPATAEWLTPALGGHEGEREGEGEGQMLAGTVRAELLAQGVVKEARLTVGDWERARVEGWRVIGFNGVRGVYEAEIGDGELAGAEVAPEEG